MKVVLDNIIFSLQRAGGISGMFSRLIEVLSERPDVELYMLEREDADSNIFRQRIAIPADKILRVDRLPLILDRYLNPSNPKGLFGKERYIFHSSYYRYCTDSRAVNITTLHDFVYEALRLRNPLATYVHSTQKRRAVMHSARVACVSRATEEDLSRFIPDYSLDRVEVIPNAPLCEGTSLSFGMERDMRSVLYVGERAWHKNFAALVKALSGTQWRLVLCSSPLSASERRFIDGCLQPEQWEHHVAADDATLSRLYRSVRCLVYPSMYEGFGIPIVEAQSHGLPVIIGPCAAAVETGGNAAMVADDFEPHSLRAVIASLDDRDTYARVSRLGRENAERFKWSEIVDAYVRLYERALED